MSREHESGNRNMSREPGSGSPALYQVICLQPWCHLKTSQGQAGHVPEAKSGVVSSRGRSPSGRIFFLTGNPRKSAVQLGAWEPTALGSKSRSPHSGCTQCSSRWAYYVSDTVSGTSTPRHPTPCSLLPASTTSPSHR